MTTSALLLSPVDNNTLTSRLRFQQFTQNAVELDIDSDNVTANPVPLVQTFGDGLVYLTGRLTIAGTPAANYVLANLPTWCKPTPEDQTFPVAVLRAGAYVANAVQVNIGNDSIVGISVIAPGSYATLPSLSVTAPGSGAVLAPVMRAVSATPSSAGLNYAPNNTITLTGGTETQNARLIVATTKLVTAAVLAPGSGYLVSDTITCNGGTFSTAAILTVATAQLVSAVVNAAGTGYAPTQTITTAGGTASTHAILTIATTKVVSATVAAGGSGGTDGTQTVTGTTGTGTKFQASVTVASGAITAVLSISVAGSYTVNPTSLTNEPVTGASLTGAQLNVVMGVSTVTVSTPGSYTVTSTTLTQSATSGSGTGATFQTCLYGVLTATVSTAGSYTANATTLTQTSSSGAGAGATFNTLVYGVNTVTVDPTQIGAYTALPSNPVAQGSTSGSGTTAAFTVLWGLLSADVTSEGSGYVEGESELVITGGGGTGGGEADLVFDSTDGSITLVNEPTAGDIVSLNGIAFTVDSYNSQ